jgi:hypothetical protein
VFAQFGAKGHELRGLVFSGQRGTPAQEVVRLALHDTIVNQHTVAIVIMNRVGRVRKKDEG